MGMLNDSRARRPVDTSVAAVPFDPVARGDALAFRGLICCTLGRRCGVDVAQCTGWALRYRQNIGICSRELPMDDIRLREDILDELSFEPSLDAANIGVTVERGVTNLISVRAPLDVGDIRSHIEGALKRSAEVEAHAIRVGVEGVAR